MFGESMGHPSMPEEISPSLFKSLFNNENVDSLKPFLSNILNPWKVKLRKYLKWVLNGDSM